MQLSLRFAKYCLYYVSWSGKKNSACLKKLYHFGEVIPSLLIISRRCGLQSQTEKESDLLAYIWRLRNTAGDNATLCSLKSRRALRVYLAFCSPFESNRSFLPPMGHYFSSWPAISSNGVALSASSVHATSHYVRENISDLNSMLFTSVDTRSHGEAS